MRADRSVHPPPLYRVLLTAPPDRASLSAAALWALKLSPSTALIFPSVIGVLMLLRVKLIPRIFSYRELTLLDTAIGATSA